MPPKPPKRRKLDKTAPKEITKNVEEKEHVEDPIEKDVLVAKMRRKKLTPKRAGNVLMLRPDQVDALIELMGDCKLSPKLREIYNLLRR